jgi:hypothetical protein
MIERPSVVTRAIAEFVVRAGLNSGFDLQIAPYGRSGGFGPKTLALVGMPTFLLAISCTRREVGVETIASNPEETLASSSAAGFS